MLTIVALATLLPLFAHAAPVNGSCQTRGLGGHTFPTGSFPTGGGGGMISSSGAMHSGSAPTGVASKSIASISTGPTGAQEVAAPPSSTASSPPAASSTPASTGSTGTTGSSSAVGLAWSSGSGNEMSAFASVAGSKLSWYYNWATTQASNPVTSLEFVPQVWGSGSVGNLDESSWPSSTSHILSFNEPDQSTSVGGSDISASDAATLHQQWVASLTGSYQIGSPAVARGSKAWLQDWVTACDGKCQYDFVAFHFYGTDAQDLITYAQDFYTTFNKPLWLTEWSCIDFSSGDVCSAADSETFMKTAISAFETTETYVQRWAWFGAFTADSADGYGLENSDGSPNALGQVYVTL